MNIFDYAKEFNADYYDPRTGYIYKVQAYNKALKFGLPVEGIEVYDSDGNYVGLVINES